MLVSSILLALLPQAAPALAEAELVFDIRTDPPYPVFVNSDPSRFVEFDGGALFLATGTGLEEGLWRLPEAGEPFALTGQFSGEVEELAVLSEAALVRTRPAAAPRRLVRTDGTLAGTAALRDPESDERLVPLSGPVAAGGRAWFSTATEGFPFQVWSTDGSQAGTVREFQYQPGTSGSHVIQLVRYHPGAGGVFVALRQQGVPILGFVAGSGAAPVELGRIEASQAPGDLVNEAIEFQDALWFAADGPGGAGEELWRSDGTAAGTALFADLVPGAGSSNLRFAAEDGRRLYFWSTPSSTELDLWVTEGSAATTVRVLDFTVPFSSTSTTAEQIPSSAFLPDGRFAFGSGGRLWASDGTPGGTGIAVVLPGDIQELERVGARVDLILGNLSSPNELWTTDGTAGGTRRISEDVSNSLGELMGAVGELLLFRGSSFPEGRELWSSAGTPGTTSLLSNLAIDGVSLNAAPQGWARLGASGLFSARGNSDDVAAINRELWITDGTAAGTLQVADLVPGGQGSRPEPVGELGGRVLFLGTTPEFGEELWTTDGSPSGTSLLLDIAPGPLDALATGFLQVGDLMYFSASAQGAGWLGLWRTDGTASGTLELAPLILGGSSLGAAVGDRFVFAKFSDSQGAELWITDGTPAGTGLLSDIEPGSLGSSPADFRSLGGIATFTAFRSDVGRELFRTDGTPQGTELTVDLVPGPDDALIGKPVVAGDRVYFLFPASFGPRSVVSSDGTAAGTLFLEDLVPELTVGVPNNVVPAGDRVAFAQLPDGFTTASPQADPVLWFSDGTASGTQPVGVPNDEDFIVDFTAPMFESTDGTGVFFTAADDPGGNELWWWPGIGAEPMRVADVQPGPGSSNPQILGELGGGLFLSADEPQFGVELYRIDLADLGLYGAEALGSPCGLAATARIDFAGELAPGGAFELTLEAAPPQSEAFAFFDSGVGLVPLGAGCVAYVAQPKLLGLTVTDSGGAAGLAIALPNDPALSGLLATAQWLVAEPGGALLGAFALSDALEVVVGP